MEPTVATKPNLVYLCQPYSHAIEPEAFESRKHAGEGWPYLYPESGEWECFQTDIRSSMLVEGFNVGVASAKNGKADYFAMIHSDISAEPGWLAKLIRALDESGADMIHAPAMIKDRRGLTSTAFAHSLDPWSLKRRLALKEVHALPDVFTIDDIREHIDPEAVCLLPNPGCMVMRMGQWFYDWPGFSTLSKVELKDDGKYYSRSVSEDYCFGYWAAAHGLKLAVAGPRVVATEHIGREMFSTKTPAGFECDRDYFIAMGKPPVADGRWVFPADVEGWLTMTEAKGLTRLAFGKRVLEIGSFCGKSTICMGQVAKEIVAVDPHDGRATDNERPTMLEMMQNLAKYQVGNVSIQKATSEDFAASFDGEPFDVVFIDGDHTYEAVRKDQQIALKFLKPGGLIAFHDYRKVPREHDGGWDASVTQAVDEFIREHGCEVVERAGTVCIVRPPNVVEPIPNLSDAECFAEAQG